MRQKVDSSLIFIDHMSLQSEIMAADVCTRCLEWPDAQTELLINIAFLYKSCILLLLQNFVEMTHEDELKVVY